MRNQALAAIALGVIALGALACRSTSAASATPAPERAAPRVAERFDVEALFRLSALLRPPLDVHEGWLPVAGGSPARLKIGALQEGGARQLLAVDLATGDARAVVDAEAMQAALERAGLDADAARSASHATSYEFDAARARVLVNAAHDLWSYELATGAAARATHGDAAEEGATFSPDSRWIAFVRDHDLHVAASDGSGERALTTDGDELHLNGRLDWVYQEEVYGRGSWGAFWWSPDSARIAYLSLDETGVPEWSVPHATGVYPELETLRYPKAGAANPSVALHVAEIDGGRITDIDLAPWAPDRLIVRVGWTPDSRAVAFMVQDRVQTWLDFALADPASGEPRVLLRETSPAWVEPLDGPWWLEDGRRFVWLSQRDGWQHVYLYDDQGTLLRRLSEGRFEIDAVHGLDEREGVLWVSTDRDDVKGSQLYKLSLAGELTRVSAGAGTHAISMAPDFRHYVDVHGGATLPTRIELRAADGALLEVLGSVDDAPLREAGLALPRFVSIPARDGFPLEGYLIEPPDFRPGGRYPTLVHTYGGPHSPKVLDAWGGFDKLWHQMLARRGLLVLVVDPRAASGRGLESAATAYKRLGQGELADLEDAVRWLVEQGHADPERVGLWGWSYGGYLTGYAMTHSELFTAGVLGAPVTDWRLYDSIYTERLMDLPAANAEGYEAGSVVAAAAELCGFPLIVYGTIDENVHPQNSLQLVEALQKAGKSFAVMPYPENRHGVVEPAQRRHLYQTMAEFFLERL